MEENNNELFVEENEMLEHTNETENVDTQSTEENVENVEQNTQETETEKSDEVKKEKTFTQAELDAIVKRRLERQASNLQRENEEKYSKLEQVLKAGLKTDSLDDATNQLMDFYAKQGVEIPKETNYSQRDLELLSKAEAESIISSGYEDIVDDVERLASKGIDKMTQREKLVFKNLAEERQKIEQVNELKSIGVKDDVLNDSNFKDFANKFDKSRASIKEIYEMYEKTLPVEKEVEPIGSMKSTSTKNELKDFYTFDEAKNFTREDFDKNPELFKRVEKSMPRWTKK